MQMDLGGVISILLLFPLIIFGSRIAGASPIEKTRGRRIWTGIVLGICVFLMPFLSPLTLIVLPVLFFYVIFCGIHIMRHGKGAKRFLIGAIVIAWLFFAIADFGASIHPLGSRLAANEASAVGTLRRLSSAEEQYSGINQSVSVKEARFGTIEELRSRKLIDDNLAVSKPHGGYVFLGTVDPARNRYFFYAHPERFGTRRESEPAWAYYLPGCALYYNNSWRRQEIDGTGVRSFAVDESGTIRFTSSEVTAAVQREEAEHWNPL